jgi:hypothetical protein
MQYPPLFHHRLLNRIIMRLLAIFWRLRKFLFIIFSIIIPKSILIEYKICRYHNFIHIY